MIAVATFLSPAVIAGLSDDGTFNVRLNSSCPSSILSTITGMLTLLIVTPLANVAVNVAVLKSIPPTSALQSTYNDVHYIITLSRNK